MDHLCYNSITSLEDALAVGFERASTAGGLTEAADKTVGARGVPATSRPIEVHDEEMVMVYKAAPGLVAFNTVKNDAAVGVSPVVMVKEDAPGVVASGPVDQDSEVGSSPVVVVE